MVYFNYNFQANVVCKMLGYGKALKATFESTYGGVTGSYAYDDVVCQGTEASLEECQHRDKVNTFKNYIISI